MPIYEYSCRRCHNSFEEIVLSAREAVTCPKCASKEVERQLSVFSSPGGLAEKAVGGSGCGCTPRTCGCH
ncbi:MAG: zinc ribbon domain-containing protein [Candidatus Binatia bacterium]